MASGNNRVAGWVRSTVVRAPLLTGVLILLVIAACDQKPAPDAQKTAPEAQKAAPEAGPTEKAPPIPSASAKLEKVEVPEVRVRPNTDTSVRVAWLTPPGTTVNDEAPFRIRWNRSDGLADAPSDVKSTGSTVKDGFRVKVRPMSGAPNATLAGEIDIVVCDSVTHSVCVPVRRSVELGFVVVKDASEEATVSIPLPAAK